MSSFFRATILSFHPVQAVGKYREDIGMEFGMGKCTMFIMKSGKQQMNEIIELPNPAKIRMLGKKGTYKYLKILKADTIKRAEMKEEIKKRIPQENKKTTRNQTTMLSSHQSDKYLSCAPHKILGTIFKMNERRTSINGQENKKPHDNALGRL